MVFHPDKFKVGIYLDKKHICIRMRFTGIQDFGNQRVIY
jgi:hypothetical protein